MPDSKFKLLINYKYYRIKVLVYNPIVAKMAYFVVYTLMEFFMLIGPLTILQSNNVREFRDLAKNSSDHDSPLDHQFIGDVIRKIKKLWTEVEMV